MFCISQVISILICLWSFVIVCYVNCSGGYNFPMLWPSSPPVNFISFKHLNQQSLLFWSIMFDFFFFLLSTSVNYLFVRFLSAGGIESLTFSSFPSFLTTQSCLIDSSKAGFIHFAINQDVETIFILLLIHWTRYCTTLQNARTIWILGKHKWLRNPCAWLGFCRKTRGSCSIVIWSCYLLNIITTFVNFICNSRHPTGSAVSTNLTECEKICTKLITIHYHWA